MGFDSSFPSSGARWLVGSRNSKVVMHYLADVCFRSAAVYNPPESSRRLEVRGKYWSLGRRTFDQVGQCRAFPTCSEIGSKVFNTFRETLKRHLKFSLQSEESFKNLLQMY